MKHLSILRHEDTILAGMQQKIKILLLEDNPYDVGLIQRELTRSGLSYLMEVVGSRSEFIEALIRFRPELVLSDHNVPGFNSLEALSIARDMHTEIPFILITGSVSEEFAVKCIQAGIDDYMLKGSLLRLPTAIRNIFSKRELQYEKQVIESLHAELKTAYREIEETNKNMTDSISCARRIQEAMLPDKRILSKVFPESFIMFKPKDIVSGDFYWFTRHCDKFIIVVADCTGHGVPGALISMIGYNLLNSIVNIHNVTRPGEILRKLNEGIRKILKQDYMQTHEGMDAAVCVIDRDNFTVDFAGANRPLFYFSGNELHTIQGDKLGVGGSQLDLSREFTNHHLSLAPQDTIYMLTDGFVDQFGGERNKKIMKKNFSRMLVAVNDYELPVQKQVLGYWLKEWQGSNEQTDDILLIGMRL